MSDPVTPNMNLIQPIVGVDSGISAANSYNSNWTTIDQHDHSPGKGAPLTPAAININSDLSFNNFNATSLRSARFQVQPSALSLAADLGCLYVSGVDLWFNDVSGNQIKITSGGVVNATSSGISSGTATASFVSSVLVVNAASNKPANIQCASILLGNNVTSSNYVTVSPPNALGSNYNLVLPSIPGSTLFLTLDTSGNISTASSIQGSQIAAGSLTGSQLANNTVTGTQMVSSVNLPGKTVQEAGNNVVVSNTNAATSLAIIRGTIGNTTSPAILEGEGFTVSRLSTGVISIAYTTAFASLPTVVVVPNAFGNVAPFPGTSTTVTVIEDPSGSGTGGCIIDCFTTTSYTLTDHIGFSFYAIGPRA